jgi:hypothetical protein
MSVSLSEISVSSPQGITTATASCPTGYRATGGGFNNPTGANVVVSGPTGPSNAPDGWQVTVQGAAVIFAIAMCGQ